MTTFTWTGSLSDDVTQAGNWTPSGGPPSAGDGIYVPSDSVGNAYTLDLTQITLDNVNVIVSGTATVINDTGVTVNGGTMTVGPGVTWNAADTTISDATITLASGDTLNLAGDTSGVTFIDPNDHGGSSQTQISQTGSGDTLLIHVTGTVVNKGMVWLNSAGGSDTIAIGVSGETGGAMYLSGSALLNLGATLSIKAATTLDSFASGGFLLTYGGGANALTRITAPMNSHGGEMEILTGTYGATLDLSTNTSGNQTIVFGNTGGVLRLEATNLAPGNTTTVLANTKARIAGFRVGDTIDLAGLKASNGTLTYKYGTDLTWGPNVLEIYQSGTLVGLLRFAGEEFIDGTGTYDGATSTETGNFVLQSDGNGGTQIVLQAATIVSSGTTVVADGTIASWVGGSPGGTYDWNTPGMWSGGESGGGVPGQYQAAQISLTSSEINSLGNYVINLDSATLIGSVVLDDPFATLVISAGLTLNGLPGQSSGSTFLDTEGALVLATGGSISATRMRVTNGGLTMDAGSSMSLGGSAAFVPAYGLAAMQIDGDATITAGTITAGGGMELGTGGSTGITVESSGSIGASVTDTWSMVGGQTYASAGPNDSGTNLLITGPNTQWTDAGGDSTSVYSGGMLVGGGAPGVNGSGTISVQNGGTGSVQVDNGASLTEATFAMLGVRQGSSGSVSVSNGAVWTVNTGTAPSRSIVVGTTTIWDAGTAVVNGTTSDAATPCLMVGVQGSGTLWIQSGGTVQLGTVETAGSFKMMIGGGSSSTVTNASGTVQVDGVGSLLNTGGGPLAIGQRGSGTLDVNNGATVVVGNGGTATGMPFAVVLGNRNTVVSGTTTASSGTLHISGFGTDSTGGTLDSLFSVTSGDVVIGRDGTGQVTVDSYGTLSLAAGTIYLGGVGAGSGTGVGAGGTLDVTNSGHVLASALRIVQSNATLEQNSSIYIGNNSTVALAANGTNAAGFNMDGGVATIDNGSALLLDSTGTASIGNAFDAQLTISNGSVLSFGTDYAGSSYRLAIGNSLVVATGTTLAGTGTVIVTGTGSRIEAAGPISVGQNSAGTLYVSNNATVDASYVAGASPWAMAIGNHATGLVTVGSGGIINLQGALAVGARNSGTLLVQGGGVVNVGSELDVGGSHLAGTADGTGYVTVDGGSSLNAMLSVIGDVVVGYNNTLASQSTISVADSGTLLDSAGALYLGTYGGSQTATVGSGLFSLANNGQAHFAQVNIGQNSTITVDSSSYLVIGNGPGGTAGDIVIGGSGDLAGAGTIVLTGTGAVEDFGHIIASVSGGTLEIEGAVSGNGSLNIDTGATLRLDSSVSSADIIYFAAGGTNEILSLASPPDVQGTIDGFYSGDSIDLIGITDISLNWNSASGILDIIQAGTTLADLNIAGWHSADTNTAFSTETDGNGGTIIYANDPACYAEGTCIATERGEVPVESLRIGDRVELAAGGSAPVIWLGYRNVVCKRHPRPQDVMPVQVSAHAFGPGCPHTALWLSPDHAVYADGVLIPIRYLVNGAAVTQVEVERVTWWHVELPEHAVLLAQGLPAESYLDTGNRAAFANAEGAVMMHPDFARKVWGEKACAPLVLKGAEVEAVRSVLLEQAERLGWRQTHSPNLVIEAVGRTIVPYLKQGRLHAEIPSGCEQVRLVSHRFVPAETACDSEDRRRLGVCIGALWLDGRPLGLASRRLSSGWHAREAAWRWTDGEATIALGGHQRHLSLRVACPGTYWRAPEPLKIARAG